MSEKRDYLVMWEFYIRPGSERQFEEAYGAAGIWAQFFGTGNGYLGTELARDTGADRRYVTLDRWTSKQAYEQFRRENAGQYQTIDQECEQFTDRESKLGEFESLGR